RHVNGRDAGCLAGWLCGSGSGSWTVGSNPDTTVQSGKCYVYRLKESDRVGNQSAGSAASAAVKVDLGAPTAPALSYGTFANAVDDGSNPVYYRPGAAGNFTA